ncbi:hypothetical protein LTR84_004319 [Exophiala bonariae]|uniref:Peptidase M28 domain-containing protein n=1 Tax=Exophiala bonariae TaxID=1690606 RepID=A0AAV9N4B6_9EURO|nr:hypothetical protein LTR84_004319 [Exophiala bonariae]
MPFMYVKNWGGRRGGGGVTVDRHGMSTIFAFQTKDLWHNTSESDTDMVDSQYLARPIWNQINLMVDS